MYFNQRNYTKMLAFFFSIYKKLKAIKLLSRLTFKTGVKQTEVSLNNKLSFPRK